MYTRILVPVDGSSVAARAVSHALSLAKLADAEIHALYVENTAEKAGDEEDVGTDRGRHALDEARERADEHGIPVETTVAEGDPAETIAEYTDTLRADLVVMGTHGREGVNRLLNGSVAERVGRKVSVPVMTLRLGHGEQSVNSPLEAQRIAREKLELTGHDGAVVDAPSQQSTTWVVPASDDDGEYNVHIDSASGRANVVHLG
ncbi:UpsA domain-containing protein [Haloferax elongans ATCC BAA-1513]|uniref:UpsA domain-containing protein n=1 Tax=Haloferax elongans ATCC BAA-1513 TaxID=1230453 RepID=M0HCV1_HALEO|nr:universal stress protein [Haloferax elongans]ELZ80899.1 UpsA domain-containing protein [Haloferax elongans ATCC BAA-1513]